MKKLTQLATERINQLFPEVNSSILYAGLMGVYSRGVECATLSDKTSILHFAYQFQEACNDFLKVEADKKIMDLFQYGIDDGHLKI